MPENGQAWRTGRCQAPRTDEDGDLLRTPTGRYSVARCGRAAKIYLFTSPNGVTVETARCIRHLTPPYNWTARWLA